jgi:hypothetical protein
MQYPVVSADGQRLAAVDNDQDGKESTIFLWDLRTKKRTGAPLTHAGLLYDLAFAPDGQSLAAIYYEGQPGYTVLLWDLRTGQSGKIPLPERAYVSALAFHPDGKILYIGESNGFLQQDLQTGSQTHFGSGSSYNLAISRDGGMLASADDKQITLWDLTQGKAFGKVLVGHTADIRSLSFNYDGSLLASGGYDGLRLWDVATQQLVGPRLTDKSVDAVAFDQNPDSSLLISAGNEIRQWQTDVRVWVERACQIANRNFTQAEWEKYFEDEPYHKTCAKLPVPPSVVQALIDSGTQLADTGQPEAAFRKYQAAFQLDPDFQASADTLNAYCWFGSLYGFEKEVLPYCEEAVKTAPDDAGIRDSRGLARALTGDFSGAIDDFQFFVDRAAGAGYAEQSIQQRRGWIVDLNAGRNPFTPELLEQLKDQ